MAVVIKKNSDPAAASFMEENSQNQGPPIKILYSKDLQLYYSVKTKQNKSTSQLLPPKTIGIYEQEFIDTSRKD